MLPTMRDGLQITDSAAAVAPHPSAVEWTATEAGARHGLQEAASTRSRASAGESVIYLRPPRSGRDRERTPRGWGIND